MSHTTYLFDNQADHEDLTRSKVEPYKAPPVLLRDTSSRWEWIAGQAFLQAAKWNQRGFRLTTAVNLSPLLLDSPDFIVEIDELVCQHRLPAEQVVWEVTESSLAADLGMALGNLVRLRLMGFGLSIDDYGTGFASMQ